MSFYPQLWVICDSYFIDKAEAAASLTEQAQAPVEEATDDTPETEAPEANPEAVPEPDVQE